MSLFLAGSPLLRSQDTPWIPNRMPAIEELNNVMEFEPLARTKMLKAAYDYIAGGVDDEWSLRRNREGFQHITFRPRMLVDVSKLDLSTELFGSKIEMPILIAPTAGHQQAHPEGELLFTLRGKPTAIVEKLRGHSELQPSASHCAAVGEMLAAQYGLGFMLARASGTFDTTGIFMVLIVLALLAVGTYNLMSRLEKRLLHWRGDTITV